MSALWPWLVGGGGIALLVAAVALNPLKALMLARDIGGFLIERARAFVAWLRRDHNAWRFGFGALAVGFAWASFIAWDARQTIVVVTTERDAAQKARAQDLVDITVERKTWKQQEAAFAEYQRTQTDALALTMAASAEAQEKARKAREDARKGYADWLQVYKNRPDTCKAAEEALDIACRDVGRL